MAVVKRFYLALIKREHLERQPVAAVLDMLRYEKAEVVGNPPAGFYLLKSDSRFHPERWRSFGIGVEWTGLEREFLPWVLNHYPEDEGGV